MAFGDPYAGLEKLKLRLTTTTDAHDDRMREALLAASRGIDKFCGRQFNTATDPSARVFRPDTAYRCRVDDFQSVTSIKTDDSSVGTFGTAWSAADYELSPANGVVDGEPGWPFWTVEAVGSRRFPCSRRSTVEITALWGWAVVPDPVVEACLIAATELIKLKDTPFGVGGYGDFGIVRVRDNPFTARMLNPYRRDPVLVA